MRLIQLKAKENMTPELKLAYDKIFDHLNVVTSSLLLKKLR